MKYFIDLPVGQYVPNFIWNDTESDGDYRPINIPLTGVEGLREEMPLDAQPIEYFLKYFTDEVIDIICKETNRYAEQYIEANAANLRNKSVVHDWKPTNGNKIKAVLGLYILMGIGSKPRDPQCNLNDPDRDRLFKIRTLINMVSQKFNSVYYPPVKSGS